MYQKKILAYKLRVNEETGIVYQGYFEEIENTLEAKQKYVGGHIEVVRITPEIDIIINDECKINGMKPNRAWVENKEVLDLFCGNVMCVRHDEEGNFTPIEREDESTILRYLKPVIVKEDTCFVIPEFFCPDYKE